MHPLIEGILLGGFLMLFIGPSFFYLVGVGIKKGFLEAGLFALGIITSDLAMVLAIFFGLSHFFELPLFQEVFSIVAGTAVLVIGIRYILKSQKHAAGTQDMQLPVYMFYFKGFAINVLNPFTFLIWITVIAGLNLEKNYSSEDYTQFFIGLLGTIFTMDLLKAFLANKLGDLLNENTIRRIDKVLGIIFILLSLRLFYHFFEVWAGAPSL
ncbi:LysE family transporter [Flammeovirgaceae bacterium SG7u.111]|nr:LysE family transporter [Flammeovirgaceae bacterium SG7u.132]WPO34855.1 LysE family transporter [Flammeovirgaceae bacterium SG7u.111]